MFCLKTNFKLLKNNFSYNICEYVLTKITNECKHELIQVNISVAGH